jgi:hypothetical protein
MRRQRQRVFDQLRPLLTGDGGAPYGAHTQAPGMTEGALRVAVRRLRRQFGQCLRATLADTVHDPADIDSEISYRLTVVSRRPGTSSLKQL